MKKIYAVILKEDNDGNDMCRLVEARQPKTAFPGCWFVPEDTEEVAQRLADTINGFIDFPDFDCIVFGISENAADSVIAGLASDNVIRTDIHRFAELIGII